MKSTFKGVHPLHRRFDVIPPNITFQGLFTVMYDKTNYFLENNVWSAYVPDTQCTIK